LGILAGGDGTYDAVAEDHIHALELATETLLELLEDHPEFLRATIRYLSERLLYETRELPADAMQQRLSGEDAILPDRPLNLVERLLNLRALRAFVNTNLNALTSLAARIREETLPSGSTLWEPGNAADDAVIILSGAIGCEVEQEGKAWPAGPTSVIGGMESIAEQARWYRATTLRRTRVFHMPTAAFLGMLEDDFDMATDFMQVLASELVGLLNRKAQAGKSALDVKRDVSKLGEVLVGV
jgi:CRP-like cAMP-binding protein